MNTLTPLELNKTRLNETRLNETRHVMYVSRNIEGRPCNHRCQGKAMSIAYSLCVCVWPYLSSMQSACAVLYCFCGLSDSNIFFHITS